MYIHTYSSQERHSFPFQQPQRITEVPLLWGRIPMAVPAEFWVAAMAKWNLMPMQKRADYIRDNMLSGCGHDPAKSPSS